MAMPPPCRAAALALLVCALASQQAGAFGAGPGFSLLGGPRTALPWQSHSLLDAAAPGMAERPAREDPFGLDVYVIPQRPGRNSPRYFDFTWRDHDYLDDDGSAGVRFYFYERELPVARIAAGLVRQSWKYLVDRFNYRPSAKVPYILYNSYREFLQTNVFQVEEGTLGVTSPQDLRMTLPFFGERQQFWHTSTHEMVHQFTIQKIADRAASAGLDTPIQAFPLWFIEGMAEYYSYNQGLDSDTEMFLRDLVINQQGDIGYDIPAFWEDRSYSFLYTYKYGQARLAFLAETYGEKVIQAILDQSPRMGGGRRGDAREGFQGMVARICGEQAQQIDARWHTWLRRRVYGSFLQSKQDLPDVTELKLPDELDAFTATPDGNLLFYRGVERETGRAKLVLLDRRDATSARQLAIDQHPGTESLHPVLHSVMAVHDTGVAWFAQSGESDWLHYRALKRLDIRDQQTGRPYVDLELGKERTIDVLRDGLIEAGDPSFSPDGSTLAFYGLDREGRIDIYLYDLLAPPATAHAQRITDDQYAERDLHWGPDGITYASDATESGKYNLFRIDPQTRVRTRLTNAPVDQRYPIGLAGEAVVYSSDAGGKMDLWFLQNGRTRRLTDFATAIAHPQVSPSGLYGVSFYGARYRMFELPTPDLLSLDEQEAIPPALSGQWQPLPFPDEPIPAESKKYEPYAVGRNWRLEGGQALVGGAGTGFAPVGQGAVQFADVLRDRSLLVSFAVYGSFDLSDVLAFYVDRSDRLIYGVGFFRTFQQGRDTRFAGADQCGVAAQVGAPQPACEVFFLQRQYGLQGLLSYPVSVFSRVDASLRLQGVTRSTLSGGILDANGISTGGLDESEAARINGSDPNAELALDWGWDTTRYGQAGAIGGSSLLVEAGGGALPGRGGDAMYGWAQFDAIQTFKLIGRSKLQFRASSGVSAGSRFGRHFFLSSFDNLRGYRFNDNRLLGDGYYVAQGEVSIPLDIFVRFAFFQNITGILGMDFGGVWNLGNARRNYPNASTFSAVASEAWNNRSADWVIGANLGLGPFELRVQFAKGIDVGGVVPEKDSSGGPAWVPNISLHYVYF
jgi:Omp85 superfamily domain/WD40-like Beta Propeller Repeat